MAAEAARLTGRPRAGRRVRGGAPALPEQQAAAGRPDAISSGHAYQLSSVTNADSTRQPTGWWCRLTTSVLAHHSMACRPGPGSAL